MHNRTIIRSHIEPANLALCDFEREHQTATRRRLRIISRVIEHCGGVQAVGSSLPATDTVA
jgi:hypothetical protein